MIRHMYVRVCVYIAPFVSIPNMVIFFVIRNSNVTYEIRLHEHILCIHVSSTHIRTCTLTEATQCGGGTVLPGPVHAHPNEDS